MKITKGDLLMASTAFAWSFSYVFIKFGLGSLEPFQLGFMRFGIAFPLLLLIFRKKAFPNKKEIIYSAGLGFFVFLLTYGYNTGLQTTPASVAGFLAGTTVAMTPLVNFAVKREFPGGKTILCVVLCLSGIALISLKGGFKISPGCGLCLGAAFFYACQIVMTDSAFQKKCRALPIAVWQLGFAALYLFAASAATENITFSLPVSGWISVFGLALFSSAYGYLAQTFAQKTVTPERIGFLYSLEPVFCAILAFFFFGEVMSLREFGGAIMILISIIIG